MYKAAVSWQKMNGRSSAVVKTDASLKRGTRRSGSMADTATAVKPKLSKQTKKLRSADESKNNIEEAPGDLEKGHKTLEALRPNKTKQNISSQQIHEQVQVQKGVKHKKAKSSGEDQSRTKVRKISPDTSSIAREPDSSGRPVSETTVSHPKNKQNPKNKQKAHLFSSTASGDENRKLGYKSRIAQVKSEQNSQVKHLDCSVSIIPCEMSKGLKVIGTALDKKCTVTSTNAGKKRNVTSTTADKKRNITSTIADKRLEVVGTISDEKRKVADTIPDMKLEVASTSGDKKHNVSETTAGEKCKVADTTADKKCKVASTTQDQKRKVADTIADKKRKVAVTTADKKRKVADTTAEKKLKVASTIPDKKRKVADTTADKKRKVADTTADKKRKVADTTANKERKAVHTTTEAIPSHEKKTVSIQKVNEGIDELSQLVGNKTVSLTEVDTGDPMAVLMMMEGRGNNLSATQLPHVPLATEQEPDEQAFTSSDEESGGESDWEEVYDHQVSDRSQIPDGPVEITLEMPDILKHKKRQKKGFDWKAYLQSRVKRFKKQVAVDMHKVHLLCLLALGLRQNDVLNDQTVKGVLLSLLPSAYLTSKKLKVQSQVENLLLWHKRRFPQENITYCSNTRIVRSSVLIDAVSQNDVTDARVWILLFICLLRTVGLTVRLVLSFQPMRFKAHQGWDEKKGRRKQHRASTDQLITDASVSAKKIPEQSRSSASTSAKTKPERSRSLASTSAKTKPERSRSLASTSAKTKPERSRSLASTSAKTKPERATSSAKSSKSQATSGKASNRRLSQRESSKKATLKNRNVLTSDSDADYVSEYHTTDNSDSDFSEGSVKKMKEIKKKSTSAPDVDSSSSESDFTESSFSSRVNILKDLKISSNRKVLSPSTSDDEAAGGKRHGPIGHDIWLEIYFPESRKWLCFDCFKCLFGKPYSLEKTATQPLMYILGFKNDNSVKDVTARYSSQWLTHTRKNRIDQQWWTETLLMFDRTHYSDNLLEDDEIKSQLLVRPMPTSIAEFKSHPLYALRRHLLKFEAIYPESAVPLGYVKKEPVYARECVHVLHSRDNWLKEGRLVRLNERPYKMVKSRPKWNKPKEDPDALDLQLFGEWQTEKYIPPPAVNGKVPRNEYGNVELFKPWMMPLGTVQVRGQGLQRVAKKLNIDVAPAMVGWDNHSGFSHPLMDGWIVCEEHADTLMAAWLEDQEIQKQREQERKDKQVYDNWRRLIRGLLIRERLKTKFLQEAAPVEKVQNQETFSDTEEACDVQQSWPRNRQDEVMEDKVRAVEAKIEREKTLLAKVLCQNNKTLNKKVHNNEKRNVGTSRVKVDTQKVASVPSKRQQKISQARYSDSSSSSDDDFVSPKSLQRKVNKIRNSVEEEDPDFVVSDRKVDMPQNNRNVKDKIVADEEGRFGGRVPGESSRRTSLARQAKKTVKLVDVSSDDSDIQDDSSEASDIQDSNVEKHMQDSNGEKDMQGSNVEKDMQCSIVEKECPSVDSEAVKDERSSSDESKKAQVTGSRTRIVTRKQTRTRLKTKM